ncbi:expressed unknown protein [Seminavis robusta]|uniref:Uncharacterized protein n=1 Tax=Seminavis robusta TaxID=568900 RepID=A0A9N8F4D5_9STRA|nr:expressed unknown protein [Seminavis robusta]|eukprot:Sro3541_g349070.1 n/a (127) ;mRNA; f:483-863
MTTLEESNEETMSAPPAEAADVEKTTEKTTEGTTEYHEDGDLHEGNPGCCDNVYVNTYRSLWSRNAICSVLSLNAFIGFCVLNGIFAFFSVNAAFSIFSVNSILSIASINSMLALGCSGETMKICV